MSTSEACRTSIDLDALMKKVERIVDEQIDEIINRKSKGPVNRLMKEEFAQGNPYSSHNGQSSEKVKKVQDFQRHLPQNNQFSTVFSKLQTREDEIAVARLSERLKESIGRAIDEFSEGLYRQLQLAADCIEKKINPVLPDGEKSAELSTSIDQQDDSGECLASENQTLQDDGEIVMASAEALQQKQEKEALPSENIVMANVSQDVDETKTFPYASLERGASGEGTIPLQNEENKAFSSVIPAKEQDVLSPQDKEKMENFSPTPAEETTPPEEMLPQNNEVTQEAPSPSPVREIDSQPENPFEAIANWGKKEFSFTKAPDGSSEEDSASSGPIMDPSAEKPLSETSKTIKAVNKTE